MNIKKKKVLLIDDDVDFRSLVITILEAKGMEVIPAASIRQALVILEKDIPNVILLDMELQDNEHGIDFLKKRYVHLLWAKIPVIVCSSHALATVVKTAIRYGADDYLLKPIKQTWLIQRVRKVLKNDEEFKYNFSSDEEIEILVEAKPISVSKTTFIARSTIGFDKGAFVVASIPQPDGAEPVITQFRSDEKSRFNARGPFDTLFTTTAVTEAERNRIQLLKTFWKN